MAPPLPMTMPFCDSCSTKIRRPNVEALRRCPLGQLLDAHRARVRDLLVGEVEDLLADHLGHAERLRLVAEGVGGKVRGVLGQACEQQLEEPVAIGAVAGRDRHDLGEGVARAPALDRAAAGAPWAPPSRSCSGSSTRARSTPRSRSRADAVEPLGPLGGVHDQADDVHVLQRPLGRLLHELAELAAAGVQPRRVHEDDLGVRQVRMPVIRVRVVCGRGDTIASFSPDQPIQQGRLADVRPADQRHESCLQRVPLLCPAGSRSDVRREPGDLALLTGGSRPPGRSGRPARAGQDRRARARACRPASTRIAVVVAGRDAGVPCMTSRSSSSATGTPTRRAWRARGLRRDHDLAEERLRGTGASSGNASTSVARRRAAIARVQPADLRSSHDRHLDVLPVGPRGQRRERAARPDARSRDGDPNRWRFVDSRPHQERRRWRSSAAPGAAPRGRSARRAPAGGPRARRRRG